MIDVHILRSIELWGNTLWEYGMALALFIGAWLVFWVISVVILNRLHKFSQQTATDIDDTLIEIVRSFKPPFYIFLAFYIATQTLVLPGVVNTVVTVILLAWIVLQVSVATAIAVRFIIRKYVYVDEDEEDKARGVVQLLTMLVRIVIWSFGLLWILSNIGVNITSLIAGLGIGGVAIAFALQNILADLFSSFAIYFDKPFQVGDFIVVGDRSGTVEKIGIKTTRVRALQGEELVFSNQELTTTQIQNFKKLNKRRVSFMLGVSYDTPNETMKKIPDMIAEAVRGSDRVEFDRAHFIEFGDSALNFEIVFFVDSPEYVDYVDELQRINLGIKEAFEKENIDIAYPTQTLHVHNS